LVNLYLTAAQMTEERLERTRAEQLAEVEHILTEQRLKHEEATNAIKASMGTKNQAALGER
jgi:hypothetical protein